MSRAVKEDLSDLNKCQRLSKRLDNFKVWAYNSEKKTYFGERSAIQWGQLCAYYVIFYLCLAGFTAIFFGILGGMLPIRPSEVVEGICSRDPNAANGCGRGPFFQVLDLYDTGGKGEARYTDEILAFSVCEPGFVAIPRALNLGGDEPTFGYNLDEKRKGYAQFISEADRVYCQNSFNDSTYNPSCTDTKDEAIMPLIPLQPDGGNVKYADSTTVKEIVENLTTAASGEYKKPTAIYDFDDGSDSYSTFMVFFRFNKVWNFQPYTEFETTLSSPIDIQDNIGIKCIVSTSACSESSIIAKDFNNQNKTCDPDQPTITSDGRVSIDLISDVMINYDSFPWRGGPLNMGFGSLAVTVKDPNTKPPSFEIVCTMGVAINQGKAGRASSGDAVEANALVIQNFKKQAGARAFSNSDGDTITIPVS